MIHTLSDGSELLTHTRMQTAKTCMRKHYLRYELGWSRDRSSAPLRLGSAVHLGLDAWFSGVPAAEAIERAVSGYDGVPAWCQSDEQVMDWFTERETVRNMLAGYFWRWGEQQIETVASEISFDLPLVNPDTGAEGKLFRLGGKIDKIVRLDDGRLAVMEHKTAGADISPTSDYWGKLNIDSQISLYMLAARALGHDVQTVLYDVLRKPSIAPKKLTKAEAAAKGVDRETPQMFGERLLSDMGERPDFYFARREIPRLQCDLDDFAAELWQQQQTIREAQRLGRWFRNTSACIGFGTCEYTSICFNGGCPSRGDAPPTGYVQLTHVHPELQQGEIE